MTHDGVGRRERRVAVTDLAAFGVAWQVGDGDTVNAVLRRLRVGAEAPAQVELVAPGVWRVRSTFDPSRGAPGTGEVA